MSTATLPSNLPSIVGARLPETYQAAKNALAECSRIDECQQWANKAEALASYAKQAKDEQLRKLADRIQARAIRRCGELLKTFDARGKSKGDHTFNCIKCGKEWIKDFGECPYCNRTPEQRIQGLHEERMRQSDVARDAGLSRHQQVTAVRVANVPATQFEQAVESDRPPTITQLANIGKKTKSKALVNLDGRNPKDFAISTDGQAQLRQLAEFAQRVDAASVARGAMPNERVAIRRNIGVIDSWLDQLIVHLED